MVFCAVPETGQTSGEYEQSRCRVAGVRVLASGTGSPPGRGGRGGGGGYGGLGGGGGHVGGDPIVEVSMVQPCWRFGLALGQVGAATML